MKKLENQISVNRKCKDNKILNFLLILMNGLRINASLRLIALKG